MLDFLQIDDEKLKRTRIFLKRGFIKRGWKARVHYEDSPIILIDRANDGREIGIYSSTPPTTSVWAANRVDDKYASYLLLAEQNIAQMDTIRVPSIGSENAIAFLAEKGRVVVKPQDSAHGNGVTVNVDTESKLVQAVAHAAEHSDGSYVLVQEQYPYEPREIRVLCINNTFIGAILRQPARVFGDGAHTVLELIALENQKPERGEQYKALLTSIDETRAAAYLGVKAHSIPVMGEEVRVMDVANYGMGGETISVSHLVPDWLKTESEHIARTFELPVVGIDYMYTGELSRERTVDQLQPVVLELNKCPSLCIHDEPTEGNPQGATEAFLDYLETL